MLPKIAITAGDPGGIGPEIVRKASADPRVREVCEPVLYGLPDAPWPPGPSAESGRAAVRAVEDAVADVRAGKVAALATAPISKHALVQAGLPWAGHTDLLAHLTGVDEAVMMFWSEPLKVVLATVHVALSEVPRLVTRERLERVIGLTARELPRFGVPAPRLALAGLNPHAGEEGRFGTEEQEHFLPALAAARARGVDIEGPFPGDTVFLRASRGEFDAVIACYHDQGLIPVKLASFGRAVNVTLGLPIVRTSVDHGTAYDIAGQGVADHSSLVEAVRLAARLTGAGGASHRVSYAREG